MLDYVESLVRGMGRKYLRVGGKILVFIAWLRSFLDDVPQQTSISVVKTKSAQTKCSLKTTGWPSFEMFLVSICYNLAKMPELKK